MRKVTTAAGMICLFIIAGSCKKNNEVVWQIGRDDGRCTEFALSPDGYMEFLEHDFGWEDRFFLINHSAQQTEWPYILPGPSDEWGGTWATSGWRSHTLNILFTVKDIPESWHGHLLIKLLEVNNENPPLLKVMVNSNSWKNRFQPSVQNCYEKSEDQVNLLFDIPLDKEDIIPGGNEISLTILEGSWLKFDFIRLEGAGLLLKKPGEFHIRSVKAADYCIETDGKRSQPLLVDVEHIHGIHDLVVLSGSDTILKEEIVKGRYIFEAPMPEVSIPCQSRYKILADNKVMQEGIINRSPVTLISNAEYVNTLTGTAHSRWMIAPGPWMPFSMVKISPDNQKEGWQAGYDPIFESIGGFSHIHEWTMAGLLMMPTNGDLITCVGDEKAGGAGYRSAIDKRSEEAPIGYYKACLLNYNIIAELTATTRCSFQRYTYPRGVTGSRVIIDLKIPAEYKYELEEVLIQKTADNRIEGYSKQHTPDTWSGGISQDYTIFFVIEFDHPVSNLGFFTDKRVITGKNSLFIRSPEDAGAFAEFDTDQNPVVQVRSAISYVSTDGASQNLKTEITDRYNWDFEGVRNYNVNTWNDLLGRVRVFTNDRREKIRFYTNMYRALCSRNTYSDVDGRWVDAEEKVRQLTDNQSLALGCDAFWNSFWNLNQFWNLVTPEWSSKWVKSQLAMYDANQWLAKGPAGMEYIPVMVAEHEIPLIVGAYQMGIRDFDTDKAFSAIRKMQTTLPAAVGDGLAGNRDLEPYLKYHFVPSDMGRFSNTLEYSFDDWTVGQFAKALGKDEDYNIFNERGYYWKNVIDTVTGYARLKNSEGKWQEDFDPFKSGANEEYVEGNAWQLTYFVPQDIRSLAEMIGKKRFIDRLDWGFSVSSNWRFNAPNDQYWDYPVIQGNQQSMHFAFLFNWVGRPWLTQKWSREVIDKYYGYGISNAYLGDEDQGQMSAWFIMAALGFFQTDGGCRVDPVYEIGSPIFKKVEIDLGRKYGRGDKFIIEALNTSRKNIYVQSATLNGEIIKDFVIPARKILEGGSLILRMGPEPNTGWGNCEKPASSW